MSRFGPQRAVVRRIGASVYAFLTIVASLGEANASCNLIPGSELTFDAAIGATNRPFAAPSEPIEFRIRPCDSTSTAPTGFVDPASNYVVTVIFHGNVDDRAVILSTNCAFFDAPTETACEAHLGGGSAVCLPVATPQDMEIVNRNGDLRLSVRFPDTDDQLDLINDDRTLAGPAAMAITKAGDPLPCQVATQACRTQTGLVACVDKFYASDGTCQTRVPATTFASFTALPVPNDYGHCFATVPPCDPQSPDEFRATTDAAGNVLVPIDWRDILVQYNLVPVPRLLRSTLGPPDLAVTIPGRSFLTSHTPEGGLLPPIFEPQFDTGAPSGVATLFGSADAPYTVLRMARRSETFQECNGGANDGLPCNEAADCPGGCVGPPNAGARCSENADCTPGTCGASGICGPTVCNAASTNPGSACNSDRNCPAGECGPALFEVAGAAAGGIGPVIVSRFDTGGICQLDTTDTCTMLDPCSGTGPCVQYALEAQNPVPLEGLEQSSGVSAFSVDEGVDGVPRNGDGDTIDTVVTLQDRETGVRQPLGAPAGCSGIMGTPEGRAIVRVHQPPFSFPAIASEGSVVAFLESESANADCNENNDDDSDDTILRVFEPAPSGPVATELTGSITPPIAADAALLINHRSLAVSNGHVFFRANEAAGAGTTTTAITRSPTLDIGDGASLDVTMSFDGRDVAFVSVATNLLGDGNDTNDSCQADGNPGGVLNCADIYVFDRHTNMMERASVTTNEEEATYGSFDATISGDGRYVAFRSDATNIGGSTLFEAVRDRVATTTTRVDVNSNEMDAADASTGPPTISATGQFIGFTSRALNLAPFTTDANGFGNVDAYVRDQFNTVTTAESYAPDGTTLSDGSGVMSRQPVPVSADGRWSVFLAQSSNLVSGVSGIVVYLRDRLNGVTTYVSRDMGGAPVSARWPSMSADGRFIAYFADNGNIVPNDTNTFCAVDAYTQPGASQCMDVFVFDRQTGGTEMVSVATDGTQGDGPSDLPVVSEDGRYVVFRSAATNLVPNDTNGFADIFVHDRLTRITKRISVANDEGEGDDRAGYPSVDPVLAGAHVGAISTDGSVAAFMSFATNLVTGDDNATLDVFVREPDPADIATADITGDNRLDDTVLQAFDTTTTNLTRLCPAGEVAVLAGAAAFLRPEGAGSAPDLETPDAGIAGCPTGSPVSGGISLNGDSDHDDDVVHFWPGSGSVVNLNRAATAVSMSGVCAGGSVGRSCAANADCPDGTCSPSRIAALVSEADQNQTDLNGDNDQNDDVVHVYNVGTAGWSNVHQAADKLEAMGNVAVFLTPESAQDDDLNGDHDTNDHVLQVYDASTGRLTNSHRAAEEFVTGLDTDPCTEGPLVAFRTSEATQDNESLNGDNDPDDDVLHLWSKGTGLINTGLAVTPCRLEACDPRFPYRVLGSRVKFLTLECDQGGIVTAGCAAGGTDLNGDGDAGDLILEQFDACTREIVVIGDVSGGASDPLAPPDQGDGDVFVTQAGRCYQGPTQLLVPASCLDDGDCPSGASCENEAVVATRADVPAHDAVLVPRKALGLTLRSGTASVNTTLKVKLRNADVSGLPSRLRLTASDGTCPTGTVAGLPDLDSRTDGTQDTAIVKPQKLVKAVVPLAVTAAAFATHNGQAPARCTLDLVASIVEVDNVDPTPGNNHLAVDLNVIDGNDGAALTTHESVLTSAKPVKLKIGNDPTATKTIKVTIGNADIGEADHDISVTADNGDCPPGTIGTISPVTTTVAAGARAKVAVTLTISSDDFTSPSKYAPGRCVATLTATTAELGNVEPDPSNDSTPLVIDVVDGHDF